MAERTKLTLESDVGKGYPRRFNKRELQLADSIRKDKNIDITFGSGVVYSPFEAGNGALLTATAAANEDLNMTCDDGTILRQRTIAVNGTPTAQPVLGDAGIGYEGLYINGVGTTNKVNEVEWSLPPQSDALKYTVGDDKTFFIECKWQIDDTAANELVHVGVRKDQAFQADENNYTDMAALYWDGTDIQARTILNNAATSDTDTTLGVSDSTDVTFRVEVETDGSCRFFVDGTEVVADSGFKLDSGDSLVPFIRHEGSGAATAYLVLKTLKFGYK